MFHVKHTRAVIPDVSRETQDRLDAYAALIRQWNPVINLVSKADLAVLEDRHIRDSLQLIPLIPTHADYIVDLGSGGGLPGLVIAAVHGAQVHLVESDVRKATFLREASRQLGLSTQIHNVRIEALDIPPPPVITARALASLDKLLTLAHPLSASDTVFLFPKGRTAETELTEARRRWHMTVDAHSSALDPAATILELRGVTPKEPEV